MGLVILFIPSRPYNPFPLSTLLDLCIKNEDILGYFGDILGSLPRNEKKQLLYFGYLKRNNF